VTYRWGDSLTNAALVPEAGLNEVFVIDDGAGILRTQVWRYPSRVECMQCHTPAGGFALSFNTAQLHRDTDHSGTVTNQIAALSAAGYFNTNVTGIHTLRALAHPTNSAASREYRVRSYLAVNCAQCHQPDGPAQGLWDGRLATPGPEANLINGLLVNNGGNTNNRAIKQGSLDESMILTRISTLGPGRMPPLATTVLDTQAIDLLSAWITNDLPSYQSFADWQIAHFGSTNAPEAGRDFDFDGDGAKNYLEFLTHTDPLLETSFWNIGIERTEAGVRIVFPHIANRAFEVQAGDDLFASDSWSALDTPGNAPFFPASELSGAVEDSGHAATNRFYRVRVLEP
jgi:mono/diheme cytochrome c family protein